MKLCELLNVKRSAWRFKLNNYCTLNCELCATLCNVPISASAELADRRNKWDESPDTIELFCERFKGIGETDPHRLSGGEPTAMSLSVLEEIIEVLYNHGRRKIFILTNGYELMGLNLKTLNRVHSISLDDHGVNSDLIEKCVKYLKQFYTGKHEVIKVYKHWDWNCARQHPENVVKEPCKAMMRSPSVYRGAVYPCCMSMHTDGMRGDGEANRVLREAGWTFTNPDIVKTLRNWRTTLPPYILEKCLTDCPRPHDDVCGGADITLKQNDVIWGPKSRETWRSVKNEV